MFIVLGAIVCLGMGAWQLARYQEASGTVQNLGYTFMWPFLAGFLFYSYYKYIRMEADEAAADGDAGGCGSDASVLDSDDDDEAGPRPTVDQSASRAHGHRPTLPVPGRRSTVTEIPSGILPARREVSAEPPPDEGLRAYNTYLAELARQDGELGDRSQENSHR